jgi:threonine synthase
MSAPRSVIVCAGCGSAPGRSEPFPFRCPRAGQDDVDHVLVRILDPAQAVFPSVGDAEVNPFLRYRGLLSSYHRAVAGGLDDEAYCRLVRDTDQRVAEVDGHGFLATPLLRSEVIGTRLGFTDPGGVWVKDETGNVAGSHKGRHLMGVLLHLLVAERIGLADPAARPALAIASCGNAALAAAVLARAGDWPLDVFVPVDAEHGIVQRLGDLGARVTVCSRQPGQPGDPSYHRLLAALSAGALPFTCQGNLNGLNIEGGETLGYEVVTDLCAAGLEADHVLIQVGGGALATACMRAFEEALALGIITRLPRMHTVQTEGAHPLERAYHRVRGLLPAAPSESEIAAAVATAATARSAYMWPWETEPKSLAAGILDDETYDWLAVVDGMLRSGGQPLVVSESQIAAAHQLGREAGYRVDPTGSAGLAGLLQLRAAGVVAPGDRVTVLFTGLQREQRPYPQQRGERRR